MAAGVPSGPLDFPLNPFVSDADLRADFAGKSMVLGRQTELSELPVIRYIRNHPETPFLGTQVRSGAS